MTRVIAGVAVCLSAVLLTAAPASANPDLIPPSMITFDGPGGGDIGNAPYHAFYCGGFGVC